MLGGDRRRWRRSDEVVAGACIGQDRIREWVEAIEPMSLRDELRRLGRSLVAQYRRR
jgi:hypothetical protein